MEIQAQDVLDCIRNQRNVAMDEGAQAYAQVLTLQRRVAELEKQLAEKCAPEATTS